MSKIAIGDADSLIALAYKDDAHYKNAIKISERLLSKDYEIIYPNTAILEAITSLRRALNLPDKAQLLNQQYQNGAYTIEYVNEKIQLLASQRFEKSTSKQDTIFDAIVAEVAVSLSADTIFSFDTWYKKQGFKLTSDLL